MSLGVVRYGTPEGGSGFIANASLPWLSTWDITQQAPVYDQETAWLRNARPGTYTNYARFGEPYSIDGGVLPPYRGMGLIETGCGMGDVVLTRADVVAPMPSITQTANYGCQQVSNCPTNLASIAADVSQWVQDNPWLAAAFGLLAGFVLFDDGGRKK